MNLVHLARAALAEVVPDPATTTIVATPEQAAELRELIATIAVDWPPGEPEEALAVALVDPDAALVCWRELRAQKGSVA
ncbi:MAG: hypothetical protein U1F15_08910 [Burkholderiales bacterium]